MRGYKVTVHVLFDTIDEVIILAPNIRAAVEKLFIQYPKLCGFSIDQEMTNKVIQ